MDGTRASLGLGVQQGWLSQVSADNRWHRHPWKSNEMESIYLRALKKNLANFFPSTFL